MNSGDKDANGLRAEERFTRIRDYFFECMRFAGQSRPELYHRPKPGEAREPTEEEVVRRWADRLDVELRHVLIGINRAFVAAAERGDIVASFRYCVPQIVKRLSETRETSVGEGPRIAGGSR
jgi:hypothetical protein